VFVRDLCVDHVPYGKLLGQKRRRPLTLEMVAECLRRLRWGDRHQLGMSGETDEGNYFMARVTEGGLFFCTVWFEEEGEFVCVTRKARAKVELTCRNDEGAESSWPENCFVDLERATTAARAFAETGERAAALKWVEIESLI
jgi:hypothetical protein